MEIVYAITIDLSLEEFCKTFTVKNSSTVLNKEGEAFHFLNWDYEAMRVTLGKASSIIPQVCNTFKGETVH